ncbi:hypothetical protein TN53_40620, partial [Streptomyces sp. WM6386]
SGDIVARGPSRFQQGRSPKALPSVLAHTTRRAWAVDRTGSVLLLVCQALTGIVAVVVLASTARAMTHILGTGTVAQRLHGAVPALLVVTLAAGVGRVRRPPLLTTEADVALVAVLRGESSRLATFALSAGICSSRSSLSGRPFGHAHTMNRIERLVVHQRMCF